MAGKTDTRQKMINMMYLVFIAMLALNIGKEVLATLGILNDDFERSTAELKLSIDELYGQIEVNSNQDYYIIPSQEMPKLRELTDSYFNYLDGIKDLLINSNENSFKKKVTVKGSDEVIEVTDYQIMDTSIVLDEYFFLDSENYTEKGTEFVENFKTFNLKVEAILDSILSRDERDIKSNYNFSSARSNLESRFNFTDNVINSDGGSPKYLFYHYYGFPLIASMSKITKIQSDIRSVEYEILNSLTSKTKDRKLSFDNADTLLESEPVYYTNSTVNAAIVVGRTDSSFRPDKVELKIDGVKLRDSEWSVENGKVVLNKRFSRTGQKNIKGFLIFESDGKVDSLGVDQNFYVVNKPNKALVSLINMQVLYEGLRNEIDVAFPGIDDIASLRVSANNGTIQRTDQRYFAAPNAGVTNMDIVISGTARGDRIVSSLPFRVEKAPPGIGSVFERIGGNDINYTNTQSIPKDALLYGIVRGQKPKGFLYDYDINITSFQITVGNLTNTRTVTGNSAQNNANALKDIRAAQSGTNVKIKVLTATKKDGNFSSPTEVDPFSFIIE
jgi:gliding motility-associated protein GldM